MARYTGMAAVHDAFEVQEKRRRYAEPDPLEIAEMQDREDRCAGDPRIEDHPFNPRNADWVDGYDRDDIGESPDY